MFFKRKVFNARAIYIFIFGAFFFLLPFFFRRSLPAPLTVKVVPVEMRGIFDVAPVVFDSAAYYRVIIENNLFRPLGWRPADPVEPYRLIGTVLPLSANTPPQAILQTTGGNQTYIVTTGDSLDGETAVLSISGKSVVLESGGVRRTLRLGGVF